MKHCILFLFLFLCSSFIFATVPEWYEHQEVVYPSDFYITAVGEGDNRESAETNALATISLYFQTTSDICNNLIKNFNEVEKGDFYSFSKSTSIQERAKITSQAEFFGVQFAKGFIVDGKYTTLAYIDRENAFSVYEQKIKNNTSIIESLMITAEDYNNPLLGFEAAKSAKPIAELNTQLLKMARLTKKVESSYFEEDNQFIQRTFSAYEISKQNRIFYITVKNDYQGMIKRVISDLLEDEGYNISEVNGICEIPIEITVDKESNDIGVFLYCGLVINIATGTGDVIFSYSRNFGKKGAKTESAAYKRAYQDIEKEIRTTFISEFNKKINAN